ncbi:MAG: aminotransferase class V-fold PLP-dependent enzyme, partial [Clostridia bacterium]
MRVYLDHSATTYTDQRVLDAMMPYFCEEYGNGSSQHFFGREALKAIDKAREQVAKALNAEPNEIYFTAGGTESDNWAIKGIAEAKKDKGNHIITSCIEHPAIIQTCKKLEKQGFEVTYLPVDSDGLISLVDLENAITDKTILITIMSANNEIGTIEPIGEIGEIANSFNIMANNTQKLIKDKYELEIYNRNAQYYSLMAQINPHFIN